MEVDEKNIHVHFIPCRAVGDVTVLFGFDIGGEADSFVLEALKHRAPMYTNNFIDNTAVLYTLYEQAKMKLMGAAIDNIKNKVTKVDCGVQGSEFLISVNCQANGTVIRKVVGIITKYLPPAKYYNKYVRNIRKLGVKPDKDAFGFSADKINKALSRKVNIIINGKVNFDKPKLAAVAKKGVEKMLINDVEGGKTKRTIAPASVEHKFKSINCGGIEGVLAKKYLD